MPRQACEHAFLYFVECCFFLLFCGSLWVEDDYCGRMCGTKKKSKDFEMHEQRRYYVTERRDRHRHHNVAQTCSKRQRKRYSLFIVGASNRQMRKCCQSRGRWTSFIITVCVERETKAPLSCQGEQTLIDKKGGTRSFISFWRSQLGQEEAMFNK